MSTPTKIRGHLVAVELVPRSCLRLSARKMPNAPDFPEPHCKRRRNAGSQLGAEWIPVPTLAMIPAMEEGARDHVTWYLLQSVTCCWRGSPPRLHILHVASRLVREGGSHLNPNTTSRVIRCFLPESCFSLQTVQWPAEVSLTYSGCLAVSYTLL